MGSGLGGDGGGDRVFNSAGYLDSPVIEKNEYLVSLTVSKISMTETGKLVIEFSTIPAFHGTKKQHLVKVDLIKMNL